MIRIDAFLYAKQIKTTTLKRNITSQVERIHIGNEEFI